MAAVNDVKDGVEYCDRETFVGAVASVLHMGDAQYKERAAFERFIGDLDRKVNEGMITRKDADMLINERVIGDMKKDHASLVEFVNDLKDQVANGIADVDAANAILKTRWEENLLSTAVQQGGSDELKAWSSKFFDHLLSALPKDKLNPTSDAILSNFIDDLTTSDISKRYFKAAPPPIDADFLKSLQEEVHVHQ